MSQPVRTAVGYGGQVSERCFVALAALSLAGCPQSSQLPGDEQLGSFSFHAEPPDAGVYVTCHLLDVPDAGFDFTAAFSHQRDGGMTWITIGAISHGANFDGTTLSGSYSAMRSFASCGACMTTVTEALTVVLLSQSQDQALGGRCPDPGTAPPLDPDAGITGPMSGASRYDAVRACGTLVDAVSSDPVPADGLDYTDAGCWTSCNTCVLNYALQGVRQ
jgi:hypothetical protein